MANSTFLADDGIIWETYEGDQDANSVADTIAQTEVILNQCLALNKKICILVDARRLGRHTLGARRVAARTMRRWPYDKIATVGQSAYLRHVVNLIALATGHQHNVRYFYDIESAKAWLAGHE